MKPDRTALLALSRLGARLGAVLVTVAVAAPCSVALAADADLAGRWDLDAVTPLSAGWQIADSSGNNLQGSTTQEPALTQGKWGNAIRFAAGKGIAIQADRLKRFSLTPTAGTVSLWFKRLGSPGEARYLLGKGAPKSCEDNSYAIYTGFEAAGTPTQPHNLGLQGYTTDGTDTAYTAVAPTSVWDGNWHALALTFKDGFTRLHVDGQPLGTRGTYPFTSPAVPINSPLYDGLPLMLGDNASSACGDRSFDGGSLDEVRVYSRALSDAEISRLHDGTSATPPDVDLPAPPPPAPADPDLDGDGAPGSRDCNDASAAIRPGAPEVKGNAVDENCDGVVEQFGQLSINTVLSWKLLGSGKTRLTSLVVEGVRDGDAVSLTCSGGGCPKKSKLRPVTLKKVKKGRASVKAAKNLTLRPKARLTVTVARPDHVARVVRYSMVPRKDPSRSTLCQAPGATKPQPC